MPLYSYHKALDHQHFDNDGKEVDRCKLCQIKVPRVSTVSKHVHEDVDESLLTFNHALNVAMISRISVNDVSTNIHHSHQRIKVDGVTLGRRLGISAKIVERTRKATTRRDLRYLQGILNRRFKMQLTQLQNLDNK